MKTIYEEGRFEMFANENFDEGGKINGKYVLSRVIDSSDVCYNEQITYLSMYCDLMAVSPKRYEEAFKLPGYCEQFEQEGKFISAIIYNETAAANELVAPYVGVQYSVFKEGKYELEYWVFGAKFDRKVSEQELVEKLYEVYNS